MGDMPVRLNAYPAETSIAEKFHAMVDLDTQNSRMKDIYDIWMLSRTIDFSGNELSEAIRLTFERRKTPLPQEVPTALTTRFCESDPHLRQWTAFARRIGENDLATDFTQFISDLVGLLIPPVKLPRRSTTHIGRRSWGLGKVRRSECRTHQSMCDDHAVLLA
jgi:Nucleotidyl transferase AbiEii toxin, Type IV TA system